MGLLNSTCRFFFAVLLFCVCDILALAGDLIEPSEHATVRPRLVLDGIWDFRLDPNDEGHASQWWSGDAHYPNKMPVPGIWQANGFGRPAGIVRHDYQGAAWYRRTWTAPKEWKGRRIWLRFEGVCNHGDVFLNGHNIGLVETFITPYEFDVTDAIAWGKENVLACRVDSGGLWPPPKDAKTQMTWTGDPAFYLGSYVGMMQFLVHAGGITSHVIVEARPDIRMDEVVLKPNIADKTVQADLRLVRDSGSDAWLANAAIRISPANGDGMSAAVDLPVRFAPDSLQAEPAKATISLPDMHPWSPEDPFLYVVEVTLSTENEVVDRRTLRTGFRELAATSDGDFLLNGKPYYLRGVGYDSLEPITGAPVPDKQIYVERMRLLKQYGFNYLRLLAHTPLREFFEAADEVGMLLQTEGEWFLGPNPMPEKTADLFSRQVPKMIREFRHHPSWYAFSCFNEANPHADPVKQRYVQSAYRDFRRMDPDRFFIASDGGGDQWPTDVITDHLNGVMAKADLPDADHTEPQLAEMIHAPADYRCRPHVWHEFNNTYIAPLPDLDIEKRLTGVMTQTPVLEPHRQRLETYGLLSRYPELRKRSIDLYRNYVKWIFEEARRLPRLDGYAWWGTTSDIPAGVETDVSSLAVLDMLYRPEKFVFEDFRKFNRESVLLIDADIDQRVLAGDEGRSVGLAISHFGADPVQDGRAAWKITEENNVIAHGVLAPINAASGKITKLGSIPLGPFDCDKPKVLQVEVELISEACRQSNDWRFWVFPRRRKNLPPLKLCNLTGEASLGDRYGPSSTVPLAEAQLVLASSLTPELLEYLRGGGRAIFLTQDAELSSVHRPRVIWNDDLASVSERMRTTSFVKNPGLLGYWARWIRCNAQIVDHHDALADFPHEGFADFQLMRLYGQYATSIDLTGKDSIARSRVSPIVWALDLAPWSEDPTPCGVALTWHSLLGECRIERGKALLCTLYLLDGVKSGLPEAGYLLDGLVEYAVSDRFEPPLPALTAKEANHIFNSTPINQ